MTPTTDATESRYQRSRKDTVRLRRPTCAELAERPDLVAQLVLASSLTPVQF